MPSEQLWSSIPPMRPVDPGPAPSVRRRAGTIVLVVGIVLAVAGVGIGLAPLATFDQICRFAPCAPVLPVVGFRAADDGGVVVETGPRTAAQMTGVTIYGRVAAGRSDDDPPPVLWRVTWDGAVVPGWDGSVELGQVPRGFVETVPLARGWRDQVAGVGVDNGCYEGSSLLPAGRLRTDRVVVFDGTEEALPSRLRAEDEGFTPCDADARLLARRPDLHGFAVGAGGVGLVVLGAVLRRRRW
ncbi:hypothetical protein ACFT5B_01840 [Luteimicrobium sp. NPDC057192]|uniref:hypothetical protein n=1 Tax=Luteimicrobium sp. NPDC057192 TaxID=3346042 RepID=UPI00363C147C